MSFSCGVKSLSVTVHSYCSTVYCQYAVDRQCMALACERRRFSGRRFSPREKLLFEVTTGNTSAFAQTQNVQCRRDWHNFNSVSIPVSWAFENSGLSSLLEQGKTAVFVWCVCFCVHKNLILKFLKTLSRTSPTHFGSRIALPTLPCLYKAFRLCGRCKEMWAGKQWVVEVKGWTPGAS